MSKGKTWQRVASAFLAAVMTFSTFSTTIAYAAEATTDSSITTDAVSDTDAAEEVDATDSAASSSTTEGEVTKPEATEAPVATETPDETDATEPEETPAPTEAPTPTPEPTESPEATAEPEPTEEPEETETPDVSESDFVAVGLADDATEGQIDAEIGDEVTFNAHVNRDDVNLQYQWYKRFIEPQTAEYDEDLMEYDYGGDEPTAYGFLVEGKTPAEVLAENPDAGWSGIELYRAVVSAMEAIGADTSNVNIEFGTRNYALEGFTITATMVDGNVVISADKDNEHATGTLNENNEFAFTESTNNDIAVQPAEVQTEEEVDPDSLEANGWEAIEGATSDTYTHTVDEYDAYTTYRCVITIVDDNYIAAAKQALVALGADESKLTDDALDNTFMSEITIHIPSMDASEDDIYNDLSVEDKLKQRLALSGIATYAAGVQLDSQSNPQWVTGLSAGMEYLTADMYAKLYGQDGKGGWLAEGKVTPEQADRYWSKITSAGAKSWAVANELNNDGLPTGATRKYQSFTLTDGKLEINSEWYGKTVYFRYYNPNVVGNTATGTAVSVPAAGRGTSYKDAVQVLFCYVIEESGITLPLTIKEYVTQATHNGYSANNMAHITLNTVSANDFNVDPDRYLKDAEGNYRNDSVYWGTCYYSEPDLSGKAYYALKNYIGNGYGFGIGHDTMYAYAGAYFDAYGGGSGYPNVTYTEKNIDPNDTATRYYSVNSYKVNTGHWNMNALMGENNSNTLVGSGYYSASDEEYFGWIVDPMTVPSAIMSSGGSHGPFAKSTIYGGRRLYIRTNGGYTYEQAMANADIKHRTPTNWPYKFNQGDTIPAALTHSNGQVAFDDIWVQYNGCASDFTDAGLGKLYEPTVDGRQGTNNFYLAGSGNFVMNQIGHLPIDNGNGSWNNASTEEMQLCVNTLMWISQRKQCEVCAADQGDQQMTHFVHRVNTANAKKILTALANGGSYWYSLNDCYELMEDLNLQKLGFNSANWKPIKNFTGHWNSKYFDVKVPRDAALFDNKTGTLGAYRTGDGNDWNLGTNKKNGWDTVFKDSGSSAPSVRTTGIARIYGKLGDAKLFNDGQIHEGYTVHIRYEDNLELLQPGDDFSCVVNNVDQYCISNLPCIYQGGSTIMRARVYDKNGNEVTKYGPIVAKVPPHFWNDCETVPLELLKVEATPIENYQYWEGETSKVLKGSGIIYNQPISDSAVTWYYRIVDLRNTSDVVADWTKITNKTFTTSETVENVKVVDTNNFKGSIEAASAENYTYNGDKTWTIPTIAAGETINITYTYTMQAEDATVIENIAKAIYSKDGTDYNIPSNPVDVEKPDDGVVTIRKAADKTKAEPGEVVTYTVTVHNGKNHDIENARLTDTNNFAGEITGVDGADYTFENGVFTISKIAAGGDVVIHYTYTVEVADVPTHILENIATIFVPGTNPEDPDNPGHGKDPEKPLDPDTEIPSNKVDVEVPNGSEVDTDIPKLSVTKSVDKPTAKVGDTLTYTVTVQNSGKADAQNVVVKDFFDDNGVLNFETMAGVTDNGNNTYTISTVKAGESVTLRFTYVVVDGDAPVVLNAAIVKDPTPPIDVEKDADKYIAKVTDVVTYTITVKNTTDEAVNDITVTDHNNFAGDLVNVSVKDNNNGASHIVATSGDGYTYDDATATFTIERIPVGESFTLTYSYVAVDADAGHDVINVAVAKAPGQNPEDPENPGHGKDPSKPIDEDVEKPSNEVKVPVVKPSTPVTPDEPKPTPTPSNPTNPTPTPVPSEKPTNPIQGIVSIITGNKKTGIGFVQGIAGLAAVVGVGLIALVVVNHKRKKDTDNDENKHNNESAE